MLYGFTAPLKTLGIFRKEVFQANVIPKKVVSNRNQITVSLEYIEKSRMEVLQ